MRNILVPVDFSDCSANAVRFAFSVNRHFVARLHFIHLFNVPFSASAESDAGFMTYEAIRKTLTDQLWGFIESNRGMYHFETVVSVTSGGEVQGIENYIRENDISLVILGNKGRGGLSRWFYGSVTAHLLRRPPCHVLAIPETFVGTDIRKILVCTDLSSSLTPAQCRDLRKLSEDLKAGLHFLHVRDKTEIDIPEDILAKQSIMDAFGTQPEQIPVKDSVAATVEKYVQEKGGDVVIVFPHHHNWLDRLFLGSETADLAKQISVPLLSMGQMATEPV